MFIKKMMTATALLAGNGLAAPADKTLDSQEKRYSQLIGLMEHYNSNFDERQYWTYGCNCLMLGDRPMSEPGKGKPVDALDNVCKEYKDCLKCASKQFGSTCLGEFVKYKINMNNGPTCKDPANSCARSLCECDKLFASKHVGQAQEYNEDFHRFYSTIGFDADSDCLSGSGGATDPQCCGPADGPKHIYNALTKVCCADGTTKTDQSQC